MSVNLEMLAKFLVKAKKNTYASEKGIELTPERPLHKELEYSDGEFYYRDSYIGSFQALGMEEVRLENREGHTIWAMAYSGGMLPEHHNNVFFAKDILRFLKKALSLVTEDIPFRGPILCEEAGFAYENRVEGDIKRFEGNEKIFFRGKKLFDQDYIGGLVIRK